MHYWKDGDWIDSEDLVEGYPGGATAVRGPYKVIFANNLNDSAGSVDLLTPDNLRLRIKVRGLVWRDMATGQTRWIARVRDCQGVILPPNQVLYEAAFEGLAASVRYTYTAGAFEQDVILAEAPRLPRGFAQESSRLEVWAPVFKEWQPGDGGGLLLESIGYEALRGWLDRLPPRQAQTDAAPPEGSTASAALPPQGSMRLAANTPAFSGRLVIDFILVFSQQYLTFQTDQTYKIASAVNISKRATFQAGAIVKFTDQGSLTIQRRLTSPVPLTPRAVLTHFDDNSIGEPLGDNQVTTRYPFALLLDTLGAGETIQRMEIRYAQTGIDFNGFNNPIPGATAYRFELEDLHWTDQGSYRVRPLRRRRPPHRPPRQGRGQTRPPRPPGQRRRSRRRRRPRGHRRP